MSIVYLKHPLHGTKIATIDAEVQYDEQNGWKRCDLNTQLDVVEKVVKEILATPVNTMEVKRRRKTAE
jgi:hypothetical protein